MVVILVVSFSSTSDAAKQQNQPIPYAQDLSVERRNVDYVISGTHVLERKQEWNVIPKTQHNAQHTNLKHTINLVQVPS